MRLSDRHNAMSHMHVVVLLEPFFGMSGSDILH